MGMGVAGWDGEGLRQAVQCSGGRAGWYGTIFIPRQQRPQLQVVAYRPSSPLMWLPGLLRCF